MSDKRESGIPGIPVHVRRIPGNYVGDSMRSLFGEDALSEDSYTSTFEVFRTHGTYIGYDQAYGGTISDRDRFFYSLREPVGYWWVHRVADDIWDNWFRVVDPDNPDSDELDRQVQRELYKLDAKRQLPRETAFERRSGTALLLLSYTGFGGENEWEKPLFELESDGSIPDTPDSDLLMITPVSWPDVSIAKHDENPESIRYGYPELYTITRGSTSRDSGALKTKGLTQSESITVHWTRVIHDAPRLDLHPYEGVAALDIIFDDLVGGRNARWGMYQGYYRKGHGFFKIKTNALKTENEEWVSSGGVSDVMARSYFVYGEGEDIDIIGAEGAALNPTSYFDTYYTFIAAATGVAKDTIQGVSAGRVTGSEVNERQYFKSITLQQHQKEPLLWQLIDRLIASGQVEYDGDYVIEWIDPFEVNPQDKAAIEFLEARTIATMGPYMTVNEARQKMGLPPLPDERGEQLITLPGQMQNPEVGGPENQEGASPAESREEENVNRSLKDKVLESELNGGG